jgi:membrane-associated protein
MRVLLSTPWRDVGAWLQNAFDSFGYPLTFLGALLENTTLGVMLPGGTVILLAAAYARLGSLSWPLVVAAGWAGMVTGSSLDYWLGRKGIRPLLSHLPGRQRHARGLDQAHEFLTRYGAIAILLAHSLGHMRGFVALAAGSSRLPYPTYLRYEVPGALAWCLLYTSLGYFMASNLDGLETIIQRAGMAAAGLLVVAVGGMVLIRRRLWPRT